jgi:riboflavin synthase
VFTGLIEEVGVVERVTRLGTGGRQLTVKASLCGELSKGDSLAVQGVCLTVTRVTGKRAILDAVGETVQRTTLRNLRAGQQVNLEQALRVGDRLAGHMVSGHVDGIAVFAKTERRAGGLYLVVRPEEALLRYLAPQGSVALDGVSLTIATRQREIMAVSLIPETLRATTLAQRRSGDELNLEVDPLARYVENLLKHR